MKVKHVVFDFGGVLYNIDVGLSVKAFDDLFVKYPYCERSELMNHETVDKFERGHYSPDEFRALISARLKNMVKDHEIDDAWRKLLLGVFPDREQKLRDLKTRVPISLLSNTSSIHYEYFSPQCSDLLGLFEKQFLSFEMGQRKPDHEIYHTMIEELGLKPGEVVFVDDLAENIKAANETGIKGIHLSHSDKFDDVLAEIEGLIN